MGLWFVLISHRQVLEAIPATLYVPLDALHRHLLREHRRPFYPRLTFPYASCVLM